MGYYIICSYFMHVSQNNASIFILLFSARIQSFAWAYIKEIYHANIFSRDSLVPGLDHLSGLDFFPLAMHRFYYHRNPLMFMSHMA